MTDVLDKARKIIRLHEISEKSASLGMRDGDMASLLVALKEHGPAIAQAVVDLSLEARKACERGDDWKKAAHQECQRAEALETRVKELEGENAELRKVKCYACDGTGHVCPDLPGC